MSKPFTGCRRLGAETFALQSLAELPGLGLLPVNAYLIRARQPLLVDTGMAMARDDLITALREEIDLAELRWIWITHADADHIGNLQAILELAPQARVVTNYLGLGKLGLHGIAPERGWLVNPGQELDLGDRRLTAFRPPVYDAPETMGAWDSHSGFAFTSDCFGALLERPAEEAAAIAPEALAAGMSLWARIDAPWLAQADGARWTSTQHPLRRLAPRLMLSTHLPPAAGLDDALYRALDAARSAEPFVGPDQAAFAAAMAAQAAPEAAVTA